jgi:hypothetical protein
LRNLDWPWIYTLSFFSFGILLHLIEKGVVVNSVILGLNLAIEKRIGRGVTALDETTACSHDDEGHEQEFYIPMSIHVSVMVASALLALSPAALW